MFRGFGFLVRVFLLSITVVSFSPASYGQLLPASPPIADPADHRFEGITEDFTTPDLKNTHLRPASPVVAYNNEHETYTVELLQVQWRWGDPIDLYVIKPKAVRNPPVILYLYNYTADTDTFQTEAFQEAVTRGGFAAVGFVSALSGHRYHDRPMKEWFVSELQESLATSAHDIQMILDYLTKRGDLDMDRVGMFAQGSGASIAILASAADSRIKTLDLLDPWGDWPRWISVSTVVPEAERVEFTKPEFLKKVSTLDPVEWLPKTLTTKVRLQQTMFETDTPLVVKDRLRAVLPAGSPVVVYNNPKDFMAAFQGGKSIEWLEGQLKANPASSNSELQAAGKRMLSVAEE